jgi:hypothetical protein
MRAKGYQPNEELLFWSKSYDEVHEKRVAADSGGEYVSALMPAVKDKPNGKTDLKVQAKSCSADLSFEWGK